MILSLFLSSLSLSLKSVFRWKFSGSRDVSGGTRVGGGGVSAFFPADIRRRRGGFRRKGHWFLRIVGTVPSAFHRNGVILRRGIRPSSNELLRLLRHFQRRQTLFLSRLIDLSQALAFAFPTMLQLFRPRVVGRFGEHRVIEPAVVGLDPAAQRALADGQPFFDDAAIAGELDSARRRCQAGWRRAPDARPRRSAAMRREIRRPSPQPRGRCRAGASRQAGDSGSPEGPLRAGRAGRGAGQSMAATWRWREKTK